MKCLICKKRMIKKRNIHNLFDFKIKEVICEYCLKRNYISDYCEVIPIEGGILTWRYLSRIKITSNEHLLVHLTKKYILEYLSSHKCATLLYFDAMIGKMFNILDKVYFGDVYIITLSQEEDFIYEI